MPLEDLDVSRIYAGPARCPTCLYPLSGQPERDDARLAITLIRCPECGEIRTVHDPERRVSPTGLPTLRSFRGLAVAALMLIQAAVIAGFAQSIGVVASHDVAIRIGDIGRKLANYNLYGIYARIDAPWWEANSKTVMANAYSNGYRYNPGALTEAAWPAMIASVSTVFVVLLAPALSRRWLLAFALTTVIIGAVGLAAYYADSQAAFGYEYALTLAEWHGGWVYAAIGFAIGAASAIVSALCIRPLLRNTLGFINKGPMTTGHIAALWLVRPTGPVIGNASVPEPTHDTTVSPRTPNSPRAHEKGRPL